MGTFRSGEMISGSHFWNGLTRSRNRTKGGQLSASVNGSLRDIVKGSESES